MAWMGDDDGYQTFSGRIPPPPTPRPRKSDLSLKVDELIKLVNEQSEVINNLTRQVHELEQVVFNDL